MEIREGGREAAAFLNCGSSLPEALRGTFTMARSPDLYNIRYDTSIWVFIPNPLSVNELSPTAGATVLSRLLFTSYDTSTKAPSLSSTVLIIHLQIKYILLSIPVYQCRPRVLPSRREIRHPL